jgi:asparagine synthase (glutamine-hydrolysing)
MCGLVGFLQPCGFEASEFGSLIKNMQDCLVHRGPDDSGRWIDPDAGIALGHTRLSIIELSPAGSQPMVSASGRFVIVFNGEIYNHLEIRKNILELSKKRWRGGSDTETLLEAIECWGFEKALRATVGMFALALWDREKRVLLLARDRMGEKPLYYGWQSGTLLFGSELKALRIHPNFQNEIDKSVLPAYFRHGYIPAPWSIWKGIRKLQPGTWISFSIKNINELPKPTTYWSLTDVVLRGQSNTYRGTETDSIDELELLLKGSISGQCRADVPLGAFLSGGIDSSTVVALMQAQSPRAIKTFTIGFDESGYNEANYAKAIARHLGTDHTELYVTSEQAQKVIPFLPQIYDEPFGDSSGIPTYLVSQLAKKQVTVSLSGDAGDELFGGYGRYSNLQLWKMRTSMIPKVLRPTLANAIRLFPNLGNTRNQRRLSLLSSFIEAKHPSALYQPLTSQWLPSDGLLQHQEQAPYWFTGEALDLDLNEHADHALLADMMTYLPDDILVKMDRSAMAVSLETRVPLLDHRIVEWSWTLPQNLKLRGRHDKWVLRQLLYRYVPKNLIDRPKMGFGVPIGVWLRGPLREWANDLLDPILIKQEGLLNSEPIHKKWREHLSGSNRWEYHLWHVLMFQAWLREQAL